MSRIVFTVINDLTYDQRMQRICTSLVNRGDSVLLVGRKLAHSIPILKQPYRQMRLSLLFRKGKLFYIEYNMRLFLLLLFRKFDIVCGIDLDTILPCYFVSKLKNRKCVHDAHELFSEVPEVIERPATRKTWQHVEHFCNARIKKCYTVSEGLAAYFLSKYERSYEVIRNVPLLTNEVPDNGNESRERFIFYQGALNEGRGLEQVITAMQHIPLQLKLAGEGDLSSQLRKLTADLGLTDKVFFLGQILPEHLKQITKESFIGVNLLENRGLSYYYSLANKFFDYVHAGVPVITMDFPEYRQLNRQFEVAVLLKDLHTATIEHAINELAEHKDAYFRLQEHCLLARQEWNWQKEEQKLFAFYQSLT